MFTYKAGTFFDFGLTVAILGLALFVTGVAVIY